jgi:hypothetical protein
VVEALDEELVAEEVSAPSFFIAEAEFLGVGAGGVGAQEDV